MNIKQPTINISGNHLVAKIPENFNSALLAGQIVQIGINHALGGNKRTDLVI